MEINNPKTSKVTPRCENVNFAWVIFMTCWKTWKYIEVITCEIVDLVWRMLLVEQIEKQMKTWNLCKYRYIGYYVSIYTYYRYVEKKYCVRPVSDTIFKSKISYAAFAIHWRKNKIILPLYSTDTFYNNIQH